MEIIIIIENHIDTWLYSTVQYIRRSLHLVIEKEYVPSTVVSNQGLAAFWGTDPRLLEESNKSHKIRN